MNNIDFIGDIHGQDQHLEALLLKMGYRKRHGVWKHPTRQAIFLGDLIDRGPGQLETVEIVRRMVLDGAAQCIMGNHELNACCILAKSIYRQGDTIRTSLGSKGARNIKQHEVFLDAVNGDASLRQEICDFFISLPLWIETEDFVAIHACWDMKRAQDYLARGNSRYLTWESLTRLGDSDSGDQGFHDVEIFCKGTEIDLPDGIHYFDSDGNKRTKSRTKWWDVHASTLKDIVVLHKQDEVDQIPPDALTEQIIRPEPCGRHVFFGHYWFRGTPILVGPHHACLDFSCVRGGHLASYRFDGEEILDNSKMVWV